MTTLIADSVTLKRGHLTVLDGVSLQVRPGQLVCVAGPNGAGKSSLLAILAGDVTPDRGQVTIDARPVTTLRPTSLATLRAVLPQQHRVAFGFTAREVIDMGWVKHTADASVLKRAIASLELSAVLDRPFRVLSGGEQARVALARVLVQNTPVFLLDEPTAALDLKHQELVMTIARGLADQGRAVVVIVHDLNLAAAYADHINLLASGRLLAGGTPHAVLTPHTIEAAYGVPVTVTPHPTRDCPLVLTTTPEKPTS